MLAWDKAKRYLLVNSRLLSTLQWSWHQDRKLAAKAQNKKAHCQPAMHFLSLKPEAISANKSVEEAERKASQGFTAPLAGMNADRQSSVLRALCMQEAGQAAEARELHLGVSERLG